MIFDNQYADGFALTFVHKRLIGAVSGFVKSGFNPLGALSGFATGGGSRTTRAPARPTIPRTQTARTTVASARTVQRGQVAKISNGAIFPTARSMGTLPVPTIGATSLGRCSPPRFRVGNVCVDPLAAFPGGRPLIATIPSVRGASPVGDAVMGRYGAGLVPGSQRIDRAVCLRGMQLGDDGLCYNRGQITNKQRAWPAGRKPLLTGGEMRAISIASNAGRRLERTTKRLQKIGLMKRPVRRKQITSGPTEHHHHSG